MSLAITDWEISQKDQIRMRKIGRENTQKT